MVVNYKCPNCGAPMEYDEHSDSLMCEHCGTKLAVQDSQEINENTVEADEQEEPEYMSFHGYKCPNCGAEIVTEDNTAATFCSFCGSPTLLEDRLSGVRKPSRVIPFRLDKDKAREMFLAWTKKGLLTPSEFRSKAALEKITGMYVPFWLYDYDADVTLDARATRVRHSTQGDYEYTYTDHFLIHRNIFAQYDDVPADASEKMDDNMMDCMEPFDYAQMRPFEMPYLSGFYAEKYNYSAEEMAGRAEQRVRQYGLDAARSTIEGYATVTTMRRNVHLRRKKAEYVLMPVWMLNYSYKGKMYTFALNGQTGKMVGKLPTSAAKAGAWFAGITAVGYILIALLGLFA